MVADRRQDIVDQAARLFAQRGIARCTVRNIADEVGILSGSLYHHFESKDAIVAEIVEGYLRRLVDGCREVSEESDPRARLEAMVRTSYQVTHAYPDAGLIYQDNREHFASHDLFAEVRRLAAEVQRTWLAVIAYGVERGVLRADVDARVFHRFVRDAVFLSPRWFTSRSPGALKGLVDDTVRIFLDGYVATS